MGPLIRASTVHGWVVVGLLERRVEVVEGFFVPIQVTEDCAAVVEDVGIIRPEHNRPVEVGERVFVVAVEGTREATRAEGGRVIGLKFERAVEVGDGLVAPIKVAEGDPTLV